VVLGVNPAPLSSVTVASDRPAPDLSLTIPVIDALSCAAPDVAGVGEELVSCAHAPAIPSKDHANKQSTTAKTFTGSDLHNICFRQNEAHAHESLG
jgi:hypothetical protein